MKSFNRTKRDSKILVFVGLCLIFTLSVVFMFIGFVDLASESGADPLRLIFGIVGVCLFVIFARGCWMTTGGALTHVFSITEDEIEWGFVGKEKQLLVSEIEEIYWDDTDGFNFTITKKDGQRVRFPYIENVVSQKSRGKLLAFLRSTLPEIRVSGNIDEKTDRDAADQQPALRETKAQLMWISREEWLALPKPECIDQIPKDISFILPLDDISARIGSSDPRFTPKDDEDFPGPVERWYGSFSGRGFTLTFHYRSPVTDQVVASHCETDEFSSQLEESLTAWKETSPY